MRALKAAFGSSFHIHLYTSLSLLNHKTLQALKDAGLDEIRTHPDLYDTKLWPRITLLKQYIPCAGIEIPLLPDAKKLTKELIETYKDAVDFINLNELEASPAIFDEFETRGFKPSAKHSYAVKSSKDFGLELLKSHPKHRLHLCTCKLKDGVQLPKRLARRATSVVLPYEYIDKEGLLIRVTIDAPLDAIKTVCKRHKVPAKLLGVMNGKVYLAPWVYYTLKEELPYKATLQKVYPSFDQTCVYEEVL
jgi:pyruvate formate-lyase activating enzyme-like uncharacterized protein